MWHCSLCHTYLELLIIVGRARPGPLLTPLLILIIDFTIIDLCTWDYTSIIYTSSLNQLIMAVDPHQVYIDPLHSFMLKVLQARTGSWPMVSTYKLMFHQTYTVHTTVPAATLPSTAGCWSKCVDGGSRPSLSLVTRDPDLLKASLLFCIQRIAWGRALFMLALLLSIEKLFIVDYASFNLVRTICDPEFI